MGLRDFTIYDMIVRNARLFANGEAWVFAHRRVTFQQFLTEINRLSYGLKKLGLRKGDRLGVLSQNCYEFVLLYGAAARLGAIMLPINWRLNPQEIEYILSRRRTPLFLCWAWNMKRWPKRFIGKLSFIEKLTTICAGDGEFVHPFFLPYG